MLDGILKGRLLIKFRSSYFPLRRGYETRPFLPGNTYQITTEINFILADFDYENVAEARVTILGYS